MINESKENRFKAFTPEERSLLGRALARLAIDVLKHGCETHRPRAVDVLQLLEEVEALRLADALSEKP
jgi:hypothetical protein